MKLIIGLTGEMGSGKGTIAKYLREKYKASSYHFSEIIIRILDVLFLPHIRKNTSGISTILRGEYGDDVFSKVMVENIKKDGNSLIVVDGIRTDSDIKYFKKIPEFKLIFVESDLEKRFERIRQRNENPDDNTKTFDEFKREHELETEKKIEGFKKIADYVVRNEGTIEELHNKIDNIINSPC